MTLTGKTPIPVMIENFHCVRCGACCRWEGPVRVTDQEIDKIAGFLQIPIRDFIRDYTKLTPDRHSLSLLENPDGSCRYYDRKTGLCQIQTVKPAQCRDFPYRWNFPGWEKLCAGAQVEKPGSPVYRGPVKLMTALVLTFGSVPCLTELKILPLFQNTLSLEGFINWWSAWLASGEGVALILLPLLITVLILIQILARLKRKTRFYLWATGLFMMLLSIPVLFRHFHATVQFEALIVAAGGAALWLSRQPYPNKIIVFPGKKDLPLDK